MLKTSKFCSFPLALSPYILIIHIYIYTYACFGWERKERREPRRHVLHPSAKPSPPSPASFVPIVVVLPRNTEESAISAFASLPTSRIPTFFQPHSFLAPYFSSSILHTVNVKTFNRPRLRKKRVYISKYERTRAFLDLVSRFCNSDSFGSRVILSLKIYPPCRMARFVPCSTGCFERIRNERREINILR